MFKKSVRVNTLYGADGRLRTSYFEGKAAKAACKNAKAFNKQLAKYDKDFINYASLDIDSAKINDRSTRYILGKLGIANDYVQYMPVDDMAEAMGDDAVAVSGSKSAIKLGVSAKIAGVFQPFVEKQAAKHPALQKLSDNITKAANNGRMPLTAESAAVMRMAFDKKYYNDSRKPGADTETLRAQYTSAINNLTSMAKFDGVDEKMMSAKFSEKLIQQMQIDDSLTDVYAGMATGNIRLGPDEPVLDGQGKEITIRGKVLYKPSTTFVSAELDKHGNHPELDAWSFKPREPQSMNSILAEYQQKFEVYSRNCNTEADFKRMLASDSYQNIERNAKKFAEADHPDDAEQFKYEFARTNMAGCKQWALEHNNKSPYASLVIPPPYEAVIGNSDFIQSYATSDYYDIDSMHDKAVKDVATLADTDLAKSLQKDIAETAVNNTNIDALVERMNALEAENAELRKKLEYSSSVTEHTAQTKVFTEKSTGFTDAMSKFGNIFNAAMTAANVANNIRDSYRSKDKAIIVTPNIDKLQSKQQSALPSFSPPDYNDTQTKNTNISTFSSEKSGSEKASDVIDAVFEEKSISDDKSVSKPDISRFKMLETTYSDPIDDIEDDYD